MNPGHFHQTPEALLACPAIARRATADEAAHFIPLVKAFHSAITPLHLLATAQQSEDG